MSFREELEQALAAKGVGFTIWGRHGDRARAEIESGIGVELTGQLKDFASEVGNLRVDPFELTICGDEQGRTGAVQATRILRERFPSVPPSWIQVMDHAGEVYVLDAQGGTVSAFDGMRVHEGEETLKWPSLTELIQWMADESQEIAKDSRFNW